MGAEEARSGGSEEEDQPAPAREGLVDGGMPRSPGLQYWERPAIELDLDGKRHIGEMRVSACIGIPAAEVDQGAEMRRRLAKLVAKEKGGRPVPHCSGVPHHQESPFRESIQESMRRVDTAHRPAEDVFQDRVRRAPSPCDSSLLEMGR